MALLIFTRTAGPALVFELHGALDNATVEKLEPRVAEAVEAGQKVLIFDLHKLTFISSVGLSLFLHLPPPAGPRRRPLRRAE